MSNARGGRRFYWGAPPDGEHPGEDYNCRCWAEPLNPSRHVWAEWARAQGKAHEASRAATLQNLAPPLGLKVTNTAQSDSPKNGADGRAISSTTATLLTAAAILVILRLGGIVALPVILTAIRFGKLKQNIQRTTIDRHIFKRPKGIPKDWEAVPTRKGTGVVYKHPTEKGTYVKVQKGIPKSKRPGQQYDNVRWQKKIIRCEWKYCKKRFTKIPYTFGAI